MLQVRPGGDQSAIGPWTYTVGSHAHLSDTWAIRGNGLSSYDLSVYGPNGFFRSFKGRVERDQANLFVKTDCDSDRGITLEIENRGSEKAKVVVSDAYTRRKVSQHVEPGRALVWHWSLEDSYGWYDLVLGVEGDSSFEQRLAGHVENGKDGMSDPAIGA